MNLLRTKWTGENWEWILGFVFLPEIHKIFIIAKISISPMTRRTETHSVWALWHLTRCSFAL